MEVPRPVLANNHRQDGWFAVAIVASVVETVFFALRLYCRRLTNVSWWLDDYLVVLGYISCLALNVVSIAITKAAWDGQHTLDVLLVDPDSVVLFLKLQMPLKLAYLCASVIPKMAIVALFIRVFIQRPFRIVCWAFQGSLALWLAISVIALFTFCTPFSANWKLPGTLGPHEHCANINAAYRAVSIPNVVTDVFLTVLPVPVIWRLQKSTADKIGVLSTLCLAIVGLGFSLARMVAFFSHFSSQDVLWTSAYTGIFTTLEPASYFLVSCVLTFRQLLHAPFCIGRRSGRQTHDVEEPPRKSSATRQGSYGRELRTADGRPQTPDTSHSKAPATFGVVEIDPPKGASPKLETAERLNRGHNSPRYFSSATVVHDVTSADRITDSDVSPAQGDEGIRVTQEVTIHRTL